jgi:hypothetical protein
MPQALTIQDAPDLIYFYRRGLLTAREWMVLERLQEFSQHWQRGEFSFIPGREVTRHQARCVLCQGLAEPGLIKIWIKEKPIGFWVHFHPQCLLRIQSQGAAYE